MSSVLVAVVVCCGELAGRGAGIGPDFSSGYMVWERLGK